MKLHLKYVLKLISLFLIAFLIKSFNEEKVLNHFNSIDLNGNGLIEIKEYCEVLKKEDEKDEIFENEDYYKDLVSLLFQQYDENMDEKIDKSEWTEFAQDIVDETEPHEEEMKLDNEIAKESEL